jgi:hypothetical protein
VEIYTLQALVGGIQQQQAACLRHVHVSHKWQIRVFWEVQRQSLFKPERENRFN